MFLTFSFIIVSIVPVIFTGIGSLLIMPHQLEQDISDKNFFMAKSLSDEIERFLITPRALLNQIKSTLEIRSLFDDERLNDNLETIIHSHSFFNMIRILDQNGVITHQAPSDRMPVETNQSGQPYVRKTLKHHRSFISDTFISKQTGAPTMAMTASLEKGMVVGYLDLSVLNTITSKISAGLDGYAAIVDHTGVTIAHPNPDIVAQRLDISNLAIIRKGLSGLEDTFQFIFNGTKQLGSVAVVPSTGWLVLVAQPLETAFAPIKRVKTIFQLGATLAISLALLISLMVLKKVLKPVSQLITTAQKIASGGYNLKPMPASYFEIDTLANDFQIMAKAIQDREKALQTSKQQYQQLYAESRRGEELYRSLLNSSADAIVIYDMEGNAKYISPSFTKTFGWTLSDVKNKRIPFMPESEREASMVVIKKLVENGEPCHMFITKRYTKSGDLLDISISASRYFDHEGLPAGMLVVLRDISEPTKMRKQLQHALKMEAIGTLAGGIAHDFNNLLMGIQGYASLMLLKRDANDPEYHKLKGIERAVQSGADLTNQLLGFARGGKYEVKPTKLNELIKKQNLMFGRTCKEITIHENYEPQLRIVEVDRHQIEQVLLNLYANARQAMPSGGDLYIQTLNFTLNARDSKLFNCQPGKYVKISITDTGVGMDEKTIEKIFDPFFTTKEMGKGTGMGLASAYGIIHNHGGSITVYSEKGHGATFNICLPAITQPVAKEPDLTDKLIMGDGTVLLVDDEELVITAGKEMLEVLGYEALTANSGVQALALYKENGRRIDIVILDMIMPGMGGSETFNKLKMINPDVKVILASGYTLNEEASAIMARGCNGFMHKPFNLNVLSQKLNEVLK